MKSRCYCLRCDYDLAATVSGPCPECGSTFNRNDPATFSIVPRHTLSYRLRRWKWYALLLAIILLWPGGWTLMITRWSPTGSTSTIDGKAFAIGRPWWLGGFWPPFTWNSPQASPAKFIPPPIGENVPLSVMSYRCDSVLPWQMTTIRGPSMLASPIPPGSALSSDEWRTSMRDYTRSVSQKSVWMSRGSGTLTVWMPPPPWAVPSQPRKAFEP